MSGKEYDLYDCNHHHPIRKNQTFVDFGTGRFVADNDMIPLLKALNESGLVTRTHNSDGNGNKFVSIILDERVRVEFRHVTEPDANRDTFRGKQEMLISWIDKE